MIYAPKDTSGDSAPANQHETEHVHTWADAFGVWHARVTFPDGGYGPRYLSQHADRIRAKARRAIRSELQARQGAPLGTVRLEVKGTHLDHMNVMHSITYTERAS